MLENKVVNEKRAPEVVFLLLLLLICAGLCKCGNYKMCLSNTSIDEVNEQQKLSKK